ncbi:uncharacterized protein LOC116002127 isoform X2 [Ipomoea triloba]|nr:uncharacterized protein LOC116002127 isoform X2 [Ipomoea triloba]
MAFGWLQLTSNIGSVVGGLLSLLVAPMTFKGIPGWRFSFHLVGVISVIVGILVRLFAKDPHYPDGNIKERCKIPGKSFWSEAEDLVQEAKSVIKIQSFQIIVAQGITGSFPWSALSFAPMWLELSGFSHGNTAVLIGMFVIASSAGGLFGGSMGDLLSQRLPNYGRIFLAQISTASAIPLAAILLLALPDDPSSILLHALLLFVTGFFISWNAPATNNPIFAEIVPEKSRTSIYALDRSFESIFSSFAPPAVGLLAQKVYGYKPVPQGADVISTDRENASSLAKALFTVIGTPMALCCFIYSFLYCTYPRDRNRALMEARVESEMQLIELENSALRRQYAQGQPSETEDIHPDDRTVIDVEYGEEELDFDESDEQMLIYRNPGFSNFAY